MKKRTIQKRGQYMKRGVYEGSGYYRVYPDADAAIRDRSQALGISRSAILNLFLSHNLAALERFTVEGEQL